MRGRHAGAAHADPEMVVIVGAFWVLLAAVIIRLVVSGSRSERVTRPRQGGLIQTDTWEGSGAVCTTPSGRPGLLPGSPPCNRATKAVTIWSVSWRPRFGPCRLAACMTGEGQVKLAVHPGLVGRVGVGESAHPIP